MILLFKPPSMDASLQNIIDTHTDKTQLFSEVDQIVAHVAKVASPGDQVLVMSNGGFGGIHEKILAELEACT